MCLLLAETHNYAQKNTGYARRDTDDSASSQLPLVCHAGPELEEVATGKELSGVAFKESESEVGV